ncbi:hypothetical protein BH23CHL2_BH23CHL2_19570 [soil metagenome]
MMPPIGTAPVNFPQNLMVSGSEPLPLERMAGVPRDLREVPIKRQVRAWDAAYRAREHPVVIVTEKLFVELVNQPILTPTMLEATIGFKSLQQNPSGIPPDHLAKLLEVVDIRALKPVPR